MGVCAGEDDVGVGASADVWVAVWVRAWAGVVWMWTNLSLDSTTSSKFSDFMAMGRPWDLSWKPTTILSRSP